MESLQVVVELGRSFEIKCRHYPLLLLANHSNIHNNDESNELILPRSEQINSDYFKKGDNMRAVVLKVEMRNNNPVVILSRTAPEFLERLFEQEVPEVFEVQPQATSAAFGQMIG